MKKINKNCIAEAYMEWIDSQNKTGIYPKYDSTDNKYYNDVFIALLYAQGGLCAYTEYCILDSDKLKERINFFDDQKKYKGKRPECQGDIEHFDSSLKKINAWQWDNLFVVDTYINMRIKRKRENERGINSVLKPDNQEYNPFDYLEYDIGEHEFYVNRNIEDDTLSMQIQDMLYVLGINCGEIKKRRREYLAPILEKWKLGEESVISQFYTAHEMAISQFAKHS